MTAQERREEALSRARNPFGPTTNFGAIFNGFMAKGIPADDIKPRENVLTYEAWRAIGRQVRKGEHGVKVITYIQCESAKGDPQATSDGQAENQETQAARKSAKHSRPWTVTVFHVSQTDPLQPRAEKRTLSADVVNRPDSQWFPAMA